MTSGEALRELRRKRPFLEVRARVLEGIRAFFVGRGFLEVETPHRLPANAPEPHIDAVSSGPWYLHTSPELCMKRLLAAGYGRVFQLCRCFRTEERGSRHLPEFTLLEWYRAGADYTALMEDCEGLLTFLASGPLGGAALARGGREVGLAPPWPRISVAEAFERWVGRSAEEALAQGGFDEAVARPDVKAVVVEGAGKAFVAGADIKFFVDNIEAGRVAAIVDFARRGQRLLRKMETSEKPVIAKVDGLSLGGGTELALACRAIVVTEKGGFGLPETGIGIYPGLGGTQRTARIVGKELAKYLVFTGQPLDGKTAHQIGLASYHVASEDADRFIRDLVARGSVADKYAPKPVPAGWERVVEAFSDAEVGEVLAGRAPNDDPRVQAAVKAVGRKAPLAVKAANEILDRGSAGDLDAGLELELSRMAEIFSTADALVGLKSVGVSRPQFQGR